MTNKEIEQKIDFAWKMYEWAKSCCKELSTLCLEFHKKGVKEKYWYSEWDCIHVDELAVHCQGKIEKESLCSVAIQYFNPDKYDDVAIGYSYPYDNIANTSRVNEIRNYLLREDETLKRLKNEYETTQMLIESGDMSLCNKKIRLQSDIKCMEKTINMMSDEDLRNYYLTQQETNV